MAEQIEIFCKNINEYVGMNGGDSLLDLYSSLSDRIGFRPICAHVNNKTEGLSYPVFHPKVVEFLDTTSPSGTRVYVRSLCMILYKAIVDVLPGSRLRIEHSISGGYYCLLKGEHTPAPETVAKLKERMKQIVAEDIPFRRRERLTTDVIDMFKHDGQNDKVRLLSTSRELYTTYYQLDNVNDCYYGNLAPSTGYITTFDLIPYEDGMLLLSFDPKCPSQPNKPLNHKKMFKAFTDYVDFNHIVGVDEVGKLNIAVEEKQASMLINVAEALHNKQFADLAAEIARRYREQGTRLVLIAGPSSSGKTTSSKRLAIQLMTHLIQPKVVELDNYFVNREDTPKDEHGEYDYESIYALDLKQFNTDLQKLINGEEVQMPTYNFEKGCREYRGNTLKLEENDILLMEGIHGLNPELTPTIPDEKKFKIYVSALTTLSIDDHNWVPTSDNRLLRRIIRDTKYRGMSAQSTISRWPSVRRGEEKWIFPFQENADATFNSSLLFELGVMREQAEAALKQVPRNVPEYAEATRLRAFLSYFDPISDHDIPSTSLLREFLGGSSFVY